MCWPALPTGTSDNVFRSVEGLVGFGFPPFLIGSTECASAQVDPFEVLPIFAALPLLHGELPHRGARLSCILERPQELEDGGKGQTRRR